MMAVTFIPVTEAHRGLLLEWLRADHCREWWNDPDEELKLIYDGSGEHEPYLACFDSKPIAYIQAWWPSKHPDLGWQHEMPMTTRGIDISIGDAGNLNKGYGSMIVKQFAEKLFIEGATRLIIDPDLKNSRAIAAYRKAGFKPYDKTEDSLLMELLPK
jgi:aminoglycoside 6'-N-acetyltransferase